MTLGGHYATRWYDMAYQPSLMWKIHHGGTQASDLSQLQSDITFLLTRLCKRLQSAIIRLVRPIAATDPVKRGKPSLPAGDRSWPREYPQEVVMRFNHASPRLRWLLSLLLLLLPNGPALAQGTTGTLAGTVVDDQNQAVPGALVTVADERTGRTRSVTSDAKGDFQFAALRPSSYTVRVEISGFSTLDRKNTVLSASDRLSLGERKVRVGGVSEVNTGQAT